MSDSSRSTAPRNDAEIPDCAASVRTESPRCRRSRRMTAPTCGANAGESPSAPGRETAFSLIERAYSAACVRTKYRSGLQHSEPWSRLERTRRRANAEEDDGEAVAGGARAGSRDRGGRGRRLHGDTQPRGERARGDEVLVHAEAGRHPAVHRLAVAVRGKPRPGGEAGRQPPERRPEEARAVEADQGPARRLRG